MRIDPRPTSTLFAMVFAAAASPAAAGEPEVHDGFFAHASVGFGHTIMTSEPLRIEGDGSLLNLAAGGSLTENLSVYGQISQTQIFGPHFRPNGPYEDADHRVSANISSFGAGATWYLLPENLYTGLVLSLVTASLEERMHHDEDIDTTYRTDLGFGGALTLGKEWFIGGEWGLGAAATLQVSRILDQDQVAWHNGTFGLLFSATWN